MLRLLMPFASRLRRLVLRLAGRDTHGVKLLVTDRAGRILLVRHSYGRSDLHMLPGGGVGRGEAAEAAARRELREETGCGARDLTLIARFESRDEGRRDVVDLFHALTEDVPVADGRELIEAAFFAPDALPATLSAATRRRIDEWQGRRARTTDW